MQDADADGGADGGYRERGRGGHGDAGRGSLPALPEDEEVQEGGALGIVRWGWGVRVIIKVIKIGYPKIWRSFNILILAQNLNFISVLLHVLHWITINMFFLFKCYRCSPDVMLLLSLVCCLTFL